MTIDEILSLVAQHKENVEHLLLREIREKSDESTGTQRDEVTYCIGKISLFKIISQSRPTIKI